jgi:hypothetical protein
MSSDDYWDMQQLALLFVILVKVCCWAADIS